jgi:hypothetical protein
MELDFVAYLEAIRRKWKHGAVCDGFMKKSGEDAI